MLWCMILCGIVYDMCNMLCNVIHDINIQLSLNYVSRGKHTLYSIEGTSGPDLRLITCTSLIITLSFLPTSGLFCKDATHLLV